MGSKRISKFLNTLSTEVRPARPALATRLAASPRGVHYNDRVPGVASLHTGTRPRLEPLHQPSGVASRPLAVGGIRTIFIQTENTPNENALKFVPNHSVIPPALSLSYIDYSSARSTLAPPHPSPLAAQLMSVDGVKSVFYGPDFITITKEADVEWAHIRPELFSLITEAVQSGAPLVKVTEDQSKENGQGSTAMDSLTYDENDSETVGMIKELLETRIRPSIRQDGGDIDYRGFEDGNVFLKLRGSCQGCGSSDTTLKHGIQNMLMHYVSTYFNYHLYRHRY